MGIAGLGSGEAAGVGGRSPETMRSGRVGRIPAAAAGLGAKPDSGGTLCPGDGQHRAGRPQAFPPHAAAHTQLRPPARR